MAHLTVMTPEEYAQHRLPEAKRRRQEREQQLASMVEMLRPLEVGWGADVNLEEGEEKKKVKLLLKQAANQLGLALNFRRIQDNQRIEFEVVAPESVVRKPRKPRQATLPAPEPPAAAGESIIAEAAVGENAPGDTASPPAAKPKRQRSPKKP